jgi:hypothetical protein
MRNGVSKRTRGERAQTSVACAPEQADSRSQGAQDEF